ncbi:MAG: hypothetical protein MJ153_01580 [Clostridia bacterium]|nr:hypothetical protein [Clostridia bacterium]
MRNSKRGSSSVFIAIILSAVITVESTYLFAVIQMERIVTINRALKAQIETIMGDYDRELFKVYGIYGFCKGELDDTVFNNVLTANGIDPEGYVIIEDFKALATEELRSAIESYYSYRGAAVLGNECSTLLLSAVESLDEYGIMSSLRSLTSGKAKGVIQDILNGTEKVAEIISVVENFTGIDDAESKIGDYIDMMDDYSYAKRHSPNLDNGIDISNLSSVYDFLDDMDDLTADISDSTPDLLFHLPLCHYASYNFDSRMDNDKSIIGESFTEIHQDNFEDVEYILTGLEGRSAEFGVNSGIFVICFLSELVSNANNSKVMSVIDGIATVISIIVDILTLGVGLAIPIKAYEVLILVIYSIINSVSDVNAVLDGYSVSLFEVDGIPVLQEGMLIFEYRDFIFSMMLWRKDEVILDRMLYVLNRDFGDMITSFDLGYQYENTYLSLGGGYYLYD